MTEIVPTEINGVTYYTVSEFAHIVKKSEQTVFSLMYRGNRRRKLAHIKLFGKPLIPASELTEFPFTMPGTKESVYHYDLDGNERPEEQELSNDY